MNILLTTALVVLMHFLVFFLLSVIKRDNSLVDIGWGLGFVVVAIACFIYTGISPINLLITTLIVIWGLRLSLHIMARKLGKPEDFRYSKWRKEWDHFYLRSFFQIFMLQAGLLYIIVYPVISILAARADSLGYIGWLGLVVWFVGFYFEVVGDWQLRRFIKNRDNQGQIMTSGLWKYTRHPNYFGEATIWWGIFLIAVDAGSGWLTVVSPLLITYLLLYVSGVPLLEKHFADNPRYQKYARKTNKFFPWFPAE